MNADNFRRRFRKEIDYLKPIINLVKYITQPGMHEKREHYGSENPDKTIYVIRLSNPKAGLFSILNTVLEKIMYAVDKGYYPVVDMMNYQSSYLADGDLGRENAWDYYFEPFGDGTVSLESAYKSKNVILSSLYATEKNYHFDAYLSLQSESDEYKKIKKYFANYIKIREELTSKYDKICSELIGDKKVVGVLCRGTDYISLKPYAHPIQPGISDVIKKVDEFISKHGCTHVYLSTEDENIVKIFRETYKDKLLVYPRSYFKESRPGELVTDIINKSCSPKDAGIDYLGQIYVLSKCRYGILSLTSATSFVSFMSAYDDEYIWNLGKYGYDD